MPRVIAAAPGFDFGDVYALGLAFLGIALIVALAALSHQHERAFSASLIYLVVGQRSSYWGFTGSTRSTTPRSSSGWRSSPSWWRCSRPASSSTAS